jgi:hypothetical protein
VQLLSGHTKLESTVSYLAIDVDDALSIPEQVELSPKSVATQGRTYFASAPLSAPQRTNSWLGGIPHSRSIATT